MTPAEFGKLIAGETEKWGGVIRAANINVEWTIAWSEVTSHPRKTAKLSSDAVAPPFDCSTGD